MSVQDHAVELRYVPNVKAVATLNLKEVRSKEGWQAVAILNSHNGQLVRPR